MTPGLPGFYYDRERRKYFKITPSQHASGASSTYSKAAVAEQETKYKVLESSSISKTPAQPARLGSQQARGMAQTAEEKSGEAQLSSPNPSSWRHTESPTRAWQSGRSHRSRCSGGLGERPGALQLHRKACVTRSRAYEEYTGLHQRSWHGCYSLDGGLVQLSIACQCSSVGPR